MLSELAFQSREKSLDELPIGSIVLPRLEGLVSSYGNLFQTGGGEFQTVSPGAFEMLKTPPSVPLLRINHVEELTVPGSLRLFTNWEGLNFEAMLTDSRISRDLILAIRHGHLTGVSPGWSFKGLDRKFSDGEKYVEINQIIKIDEISFCSNPAQNETRCGFAGRARLSGPSQSAPLFSSEATRLQTFLDHVEFAADKIRSRPFVQPKPAALKTKAVSVRAVPAKSQWQRVGCRMFQ